MPPNRLRIERQEAPGSITFVLVGELDLAVVGNVEPVLDAETAGTCTAVAVDLSGLEFIGFAGVDLLVDFARRLAAQRRCVRVAASNRTVDRAFELAGVQLVTTIDSADLLVPTRRSSRVPDPERASAPGRGSPPPPPNPAAAPVRL